MPTRNTDIRWGWPSMTLHWGIALLILALLGLGFVMGELPRSPKYFWVYDLHKSLGLTVLALMLIRLAWRLYAGAPRPEPGMPGWQNLVAGATHWAVYALALAMPVSGWLYDSASGLRTLKFFGLVTVPKLSAPDPEIKNLSHAVHEYGAWILIVLILMHASAALYHHFIQRDRTLLRMLPASFEKSR
ncbi:cytochrome b [Xanthomonadaceae bacterium JHOS43]|nr:cytochrome b [Xanthomonadaceae bacterium JHOS43]MCX7564150.1 cytochrome b [Xanthomonadaceae bacterium XH05]